MRKLFLLFSLSVFWLLLSGIYDNWLLLLLGGFSVIIATLLAVHIGAVDREGAPSHLFPHIITYSFWLFGQIALANFQVIKEILSVKPNIAPQFILIKFDSGSIMAHVILANSITLTPGTVTIDVRKKSLLVHALNDNMADQEGIYIMGNYLKKVSPSVNKPSVNKLSVNKLK